MPIVITDEEYVELEKLKKFARDVITSECFGGEIDGGELQEIAENRGIR